jgi:hypothetical protein
MSGIDPNARKQVNDALISSGSAGVGQIVDTANSSIEKRRKNKEERAKREAEEKAARERADAAVVRAQILTPKIQESESPDLRCANACE